MDKKSNFVHENMKKTKIGYLNKIAEDFKTDLTAKIEKPLGLWSSP